MEIPNQIQTVRKLFYLQSGSIRVIGPQIAQIHDLHHFVYILCIYIYLSLFLSSLSLLPFSQGQIKMDNSPFTLKHPQIFRRSWWNIHPRYWPWPSAPSRYVMNEPPWVGWFFSLFCMRKDAGRRHFRRHFRLGCGRSVKIWIWTSREIWGTI